MLTSGERTRRRKTHLCASEIMTLLIYFHQIGYRDFKTFYTEHVWTYHRTDFPNLVSYPRFISLLPRILRPLMAYLYTLFGECSGISFVDSTALTVCNNRRIRAHQVFVDLAARGKTSMGWFYGFKLHLIVNERGELLTCHFTPGNVDDRKPVPRMSRQLWGKLFGDRGDISEALMDQLRQLHNLQLITKLRKNIKNRLMLLTDKILLRKRVIIETIIDQLKNISQIEHTRHRSPVNFFVNVLAGLIAYCHQPKKPALRFPGMEGALALIHN